MSQLAVVSTHPAPGSMSDAPAAHDLRNLLATVALHVETLQRLAGPGGTKAASAAHALVERGAKLCNAALERGAIEDRRTRRRGVDLIQAARQVAELLWPIAPEGFVFAVPSSGTASVLADPDEVFRILFNLVNNAVAVAAHKAGALTTLSIGFTSADSIVTMRVADDGPGLPPSVRAALFGAKSQRGKAPQHGHGLAIARELAERNGGTLTLAPAATGTAFMLKLPAFLSVIACDGVPHLGRHAMAV
jgi:signal transduction histidine kinase